MLNTGSNAQAAATPVMGLRPVKEPLPWFDSRRNYLEYDAKTQRMHPNRVPAVTSLGRPPMDAPVSIELSRHVYPAEDKHVDAIVRFDLPLAQTPRGQLQVKLRSRAGDVLSETVIDPIPGPQVFFSYRFPDEVIGGSGRMDIRWVKAAQAVGGVSAEFQVAARKAPVVAGRISLKIANDAGAKIPAAPVTVGVPFPRGALESTDNLRLVRKDGREIPLQVKETARWSRFGSIKWVLCDFAVILDGGPRELFLEYGPKVTRAERGTIDVVAAKEGFPLVAAGRVRLDGSGLSCDVAGDGKFRNILRAEALTGAFVQHVNNADYVGWGHRWMSNPGTEYKMPGRLAFEIEEVGPEKVVLRLSDWYENAETGRRFCQFVTRYVVHRDSPVVRIFHTWIFTGDGNRDPIRNMGWRFGLNGMKPSGFLSGFGADAEWLDGYYLRQEDSDKFTLFDFALPKRHAYWVLEGHQPARPIKEKRSGKRATGVMSARGDGVRLYIGVKGFWQNFPRSLKQEEDALTFYEWPQYGRDHQHPLSVETMGDAWRLWFAHEGETLNFAIPQELTEGTLFRAHSGPETRFLYGRPDSVNAQGVAKTAEMWIYLASEEDAPNAVCALQGLQGETLRAVVDPQWLAGSDVFHGIAPRLPGRYPEDENIYAENVRSALRDVERMGIYGKWIYGDLLTTPALEARTAGLNRARATSWGYPFRLDSLCALGRSGVLRFRPGGHNLSDRCCLLPLRER